jgi:hypothetical protein
VADECCGTCRHWRRAEDTLGGQGQCHRRAPAAEVIAARTDLPEHLTVLTVWPPTRAEDGCGEWHPAPPRQGGGGEGRYTAEVQKALVEAEGED